MRLEGIHYRQNSQQVQAGCGGLVWAMERFLVSDFIVDPGRNVIVAPDGGETRLEPKVMEVLCVLAAQPGEVVTRNQLIDQVWSVEFGADEAPTRAISILRKVFGDSGNGARCIETIPRRGYRLTAPVTIGESGSAPATAEGVALGIAGALPHTAVPPAHLPVRSNSDVVARTGSGRTDSGGDFSSVSGSFKFRIGRTLAGLVRKRAPLILAGVAVATAGVLLAVFFTQTGDRMPDLTGAPHAGGKTVAVLPFVNRSTAEKDAFLADGFHETLLTQLSKISGLKIISRTSMLQYRKTEKSAPRIARELGATVVMEGSLQRSGKRIRINVQLIDGADDTHLWAEIYDVDLTPENLFAVQSDISRTIADALETVLTDTEREVLSEVPTRNPAAWEAYLRGRIDGDMERFSAVLWQQAIEEYETAVRLDPGFGEAHAGKARTHLQLYWVGKNAEHLEAADRALRQAEALAPEAVETLTARAWYHYWAFFDYEKADALLRKALKKAPNSAETLTALGAVARRAGRFDDAVRYFERARQLNPLSLTIIHGLAITHVVFGRFEAAQSMVAQAKQIDPANSLTIWTAAMVALYMGKPKQAWNEYEVPVVNADEEFFVNRSVAARLTGNPAHLEAALADWPESLRRPKGRPELYAIWQAFLLEMRGKSEQAQALFSELADRIEATPELIGWGRAIEPHEPPYWRRDLEGVRAAFAEFESSRQKDAWWRLFQLNQFARAFARAGDPESAFNLIEAYVKRTAPSAYLRIAVQPEFDKLRDHPRYLALKAEYEKWAKEEAYQ